VFVHRGVLDYIRSDNGSEFTAGKIRDWLARLGVKTPVVEPGSPRENGYIESFNGKLRDELLNVEIFDTLLEAKVLIERWRWEYNTIRPHSSLGYRPPAPEAVQPWLPASATFKPTRNMEELDGVLLRHSWPVLVNRWWDLCYNDRRRNPEAMNSLEAGYTIRLAFARE